ncbi:MAG TPA: 16S rRNA (uracil(1498)-N(3))-methyltransferase [Balneolales bacterium]|nr:16S rRNA (uracil(1498)-N(3))-methyltransferase [Balneolales bacterium]
MNLFYAPPGQCSDDIVYLRDDEAHHAAHVLRYKTGDAISVVDGRGSWFDGEIISISKKEVVIAVKKIRRLVEEKKLKHRILALGLIKNRQRLEFAVEKAVELGTTEIVLFRSRNTEREKVRMDRLDLIARSAMKQSLRAWLPEVRFLSSISNLVDEYRDCHMLLAHEKHEGTAEVNPAWLREDRIMVLIGPEGGFSDDEVESLTQSGAELVSLGTYRLRAETAAIAFLARLIG